MFGYHLVINSIFGSILASWQRQPCLNWNVPVSRIHCGINIRKIYQPQHSLKVSCHHAFHGHGWLWLYTIPFVSPEGFFNATLSNPFYYRKNQPFWILQFSAVFDLLLLCLPHFTVQIKKSDFLLTFLYSFKILNVNITVLFWQ